MDICKDHFDEGNALNVEIDISVSYIYVLTMICLIYAVHSTKIILLNLQIQVFDTVNLLRRVGNLTVNVSDRGEIVVRGDHLPFNVVF